MAKAGIKEIEYIKFTENLLKNYRHIEISIWNLEKQLEEIEDDFTSLPAIVYDDMKVQKSVSGSPIEQSALLLIEKKKELEKDIEKNKRLIRSVEIGMNNLSPIHREVLQLFVIEGNDWRYVCDKLNYGERQLREKKNQAVKSIACTLFGGKVFDKEENLLNILL